jgi:hypothetical protein
MGFLGYHFVEKTPELVASRRIALDWYSTLAQLSQFVVLLTIPFCQFVFSAIVKSSGNKYEADGDISLVSKRSGGAKYNAKGKVAAAARWTRIIKFRLGTEVLKGYGTYGEWIFGLLWGVWLGFLCVSETAPGILIVKTCKMTTAKMHRLSTLY